MATITITTDSENALRVAKAVGRNFGYRDANDVLRNATLTEITNALRMVLKNWVLQSEAQEAAEAAAVTVGAPVMT